MGPSVLAKATCSLDMEAYRCDFKQQQRSALQNLVEDLSVISLLSLIKCWNKWYLWIFFSEVHTVWLYLCKGFLRELYYTDHDSTKCYEYTHKFVQLSLGRGLKQSPTFFFFNCRTSEKLECVCVCVCVCARTRVRAHAHVHTCGYHVNPKGAGISVSFSHPCTPSAQSSGWHTCVAGMNKWTR